MKRVFRTRTCPLCRRRVPVFPDGRTFRTHYHIGNVIWDAPRCPGSTLTLAEAKRLKANPHEDPVK